jgi:hypothetical protein
MVHMNVSPGADRNVVDDLEVKELHVSPLDKNGSANTEEVWRAPKKTFSRKRAEPFIH